MDKVDVKENKSCPVMSISLQSMDYTIHGILQARLLEWVAFPFSRGSSQPRNWTRVSCIAGRFFTNWAIREPTCRNRVKNYHRPAMGWEEEAFSHPYFPTLPPSTFPPCPSSTDLHLQNPRDPGLVHLGVSTRIPVASLDYDPQM